MQRIYLKERSFEVDTLPSEAGLLVELMDLCRNEEATFEMYATAIKRDTGLTAQFIKLANSPLYRQWNELTDLKRMLVVLGMRNVRKIIITSAIQNFFSILGKQNDELLYRIWLRSLVCAHLSDRLANKINYRHPEEAYLAGLLHQIGMLLLLINYKENYHPLLEQFDATEDFCAIEQSNYKLDHCEVGSALIESWGLDSLLADAVLFQYAAAEELVSSPALLRLLAVARSMVSPLDGTVSANILDKAELLLELPAESCQECLAAALDDSHKVLSELGLSDEAAELTALTTVSESVRAQKNALLGERIKSISLTYCFLNGESYSLENLVQELRLNFDLLFNRKQLIFLQQQDNRLTVLNDLNLGKLNELGFSLQDPNSAIVRCLTSKKPLMSSSTQCSIADRQIIRSLGSECSCFIPIYSDNQDIGVLVVGAPSKESNVLEEQLPLMQLLLSEIGKKYQTFSTTDHNGESISLSDFNKIVHEVKNPLTIIKNYLYILANKLEDHPATEEINFIKREMARVEAILSRTKQTEQVTEVQQSTDINQLLQELDNFFSNSLYQEHGISTQLTLDSGIPPLNYPEHKLKQVFINLVKNAAEALPKAGEINITTRDNCFRDGCRLISISIKDNGPGIPEQVLQNLFKPVTSTKPGHSGLGLSIVAELIAGMSGSISCYSSSKGTEFNILLPRTGEETPTE